MSRIDELLAELSPSGVRFCGLAEVADYSNTRADAADLDATTFVGVDNLLPNKQGKTDANYLPNTSRLTAYQVGDILLGNIRPYLKKVWLATNAGGCSGDVLALRIGKESRAGLEPRFLYYVLSSDGFFAYNMQHAKGAKMPRGNKEAILRHRIPVPPLEVQREIVSILETFTALEAELQAELQARRRQFAHYLNSMLRFRGRSDVAWMTLGEIGTFIRGRRFTKADYASTGIAAIHYGEIYTHFGTSTRFVRSHLRPDLGTSLRYALPGDVVVVDVGETVEDVGKAVAWLGDEPVAIHDHCYAFRHTMNPTYVSYCLQTADFRSERGKYVARTKVKTLLVDGFSKIKIPVPSLAEQDEIVRQLDSFDALVSDLSVGLPAELASRRQQYEYYRDRLLSFEELGA